MLWILQLLAQKQDKLSGVHIRSAFSVRFLTEEEFKEFRVEGNFPRKKDYIRKGQPSVNGVYFLNGSEIVEGRVQRGIRRMI